MYDASVWRIFEKIKDEDYMKERVYDIYGDEFKKLSDRLFESYYLNQNDVYTYVFPMPFADFAKMEYINFMANRNECSDAEFKVVCEDCCVEYVRKFLDEMVEVCCLEGEEI